MDWFDREMQALDEQLERGDIDREEYAIQVRLLRRDARDAQDREDIIAAGRGHLLK